MSRSRLHSPVWSYTARGVKPGIEKWWKRYANGALRSHVRDALHRATDAPVLPELREVSNVWSWPKDGKHAGWRYDPTQAWCVKAMRK